MRPVHLRMVELKRNGKRRFQEMPFVLAPYQERIVEYAAVHSHRAVDLVPRESGGAYDHAIRQIVVFARFGDLTREPHIIVVEPPQIVGKGDIARTHLAPAVGHYGVDGDLVVLHQLVADWQQIELFHAARRTADAPAHRHIELKTLFAAQTHEARHVERLEKRHHRHRRAHPHLESVSA